MFGFISAGSLCLQFQCGRSRLGNGEGGENLEWRECYLCMGHLDLYMSAIFARSFRSFSLCQSLSAATASLHGAFRILSSCLLSR